MATEIPELWTANARQRNNVKEIGKAVEDHYKVLFEKDKEDAKKVEEN